MNITNQLFSYLVRIQIGPHSFSMLVVNKKEVPKELLEIMAKEKIEKNINDLYKRGKDYRLQTSQQYFSKMIKQSNFEVEDLNNIEIYDLDLKFDSTGIKNEVNEKKETKIFESKFNSEEFQLNDPIPDP